MIFMVLKSHCESLPPITRFVWWMQTQR